VGKLVNLSDLLVHEPLAGKAGIGHTRWATHGAPSVRNAHPHQCGPVAVVHNGIIENYKDLREELAAKGYATETETDTETVALLAQSFMDQGLAPRDAAEQTIARLDGAFALAFLFEGEDDLIIAARKGSPLAIGHGDGEMFLGSDAIALAPMTDRITYLEEGDRAVLTRKGWRSWTRAATAPTAPSAPSRSTPPASTRRATSTSWPRRSPNSRPSSPAPSPITSPTPASASPKASSTSPASTASSWSPAAPPSTPASPPATGSSAWRACRSRSISPPNSATASPSSARTRWRSSSPSRARRRTRSPRCATAPRRR
jgi:hypothetical protein